MDRAARIWPGLLAHACAAGVAFAAAPALVLVEGTLSCPDAPERNYAGIVTRRLDAWLGELGLAPRVVAEEALDDRALAGVRVAVLGYNPFPPEPVLRVLERYVAGGGRLMVFYSASPELARLAGLRLGPYRAEKLGGRWSTIRFAAGAPPHAPPFVRQESRNIRPALPAGPGADVIAVWTGADGGAGAASDPAWTRSPKALWMSHILLDDGDTWRKKCMLLALLAPWLPDAWQAAAERLYAESGRLEGRHANFAAATRALRSGVEAAGPTAAAAAGDALLRAETHHRRAGEHLRAGRHADAFEESARARDMLVACLARLQTPRTPERRGVWDHAGTGLYPRQWDRTMDALAAAGVNTLFVNMLWPGVAHCAGDVVPPSDVQREWGDQLAPCLEAARPRAIEVHVWKVCWNLAGAPTDWVAQLRRDGRLQVSNKGETVNWLCPSQAANLQYEKDAIRDLVRRHRPAGVHLDYVRYPDSRTCYCAACRRGFEAQLGRAVERWPDEALAPALRSKYREWRAGRITQYVRDVRALLSRTDPAIKLSAAVFGKYPLCAESVGQDWGRWLREGMVDFVCPMDYTADTDAFTALVRAQTALPGAAGRICPGIGVTARESRLGPVAVIEQVSAARAAGAAGFALFDLNFVLADEILPALGAGLTRGSDTPAPAAPPAPPGGTGPPRR